MATVTGKLPKSQGVVAHHILQAYVYGSERQQKRIETYGRMNKKILRGIGKPHDQDGTSDAKKR
jgi:hypothetical protein